ncbi:hypothetical protein M9H77_25504 [Catharanthus roseus]|uniref:Uncharacterized protein n=1 Tax=Catharanthus roseus TaxID=4058 RepID=A0ACC0A7G3_CATRO|nr:hypothetical protein M9H77_25504 [Catharanthus roseus]
MLQEVDDMALVVIQELPTFPSQMAVFAKKVQTIIQRCMHDIQQTFPVQPSRRRPREHVPDRGARGVKRGARRQPGRRARGGRPLVPSFLGHVEMERVEGSGQLERGEGFGGGHHLVNPFDSPNLDMPSFSGSGTLCVPPPPGLGFAPFQSPADTSLGFSSFCAPPPPETAGSSTLHQPTS